MPPMPHIPATLLRPQEAVPEAALGKDGSRAELAAAVVAGALLLAGWLAERTGVGAGLGAALIWTSLSIGMVFGGRAALAALRAMTFDIDVLMVVGAGFAA